MVPPCHDVWIYVSVVLVFSCRSWGMTKKLSFHLVLDLQKETCKRWLLKFGLTTSWFLKRLWSASASGSVSAFFQKTFWYQRMECKYLHCTTDNLAPIIDLWSWKGFLHHRRLQCNYLYSLLWYQKGFIRHRGNTITDTGADHKRFVRTHHRPPSAIPYLLLIIIHVYNGSFKKRYSLYLVSMVTFIVVIFDGIAGFTAHCTLVLLVTHPGLIPDQFSARPVPTVVELSSVVSVNTGFWE